MMGIAHYNMPPASIYTDLKKMRWPTEGKEKITHIYTQLTPQPTAKEDKRSHREKNMPSIRFEFYPDSVYIWCKGQMYNGIYFSSLGVYLHIRFKTLLKQNVIWIYIFVLFVIYIHNH